uniref:Uncharacterized protein n=1 Tax=Alexandrium monilatum TaxID=311494 RepID=A0A7S4Q5Q2_9DINO|mmetsp:Transcript_107713/g.322189  ORF Transcript_107713/g.322189 Transcript_107713/m.322189 type:complete len:285 (+) Transcript_107713:129-983(+)
MNKVLHCCHGMFEPQQGQGHWICSTRSAGAGAKMDEEVISDEAVGSMGDDGKGGSRSGARGRPGPPVPIGGPGAAEDEKETAKQRLQRLIRDFAHDAVGRGLPVEASCQTLAVTAECNGTMEAKLRVDRKLSRLELWSHGGAGGDPVLKGEHCVMKVPLQQVKQIYKLKGAEPGDVTEADGAAGGARAEASSSKDETGADADEGSRQANGSLPSASPRGNTALCVVRRPTANGALPDLRLTFESVAVRDRAYTCLRIFQMSVDQSNDGQSREAESDVTGNDSSV